MSSFVSFYRLAARRGLSIMAAICFILGAVVIFDHEILGVTAALTAPFGVHLLFTGLLLVVTRLLLMAEFPILPVSVSEGGFPASVFIWKLMLCAGIPILISSTMFVAWRIFLTGTDVLLWALFWAAAGLTGFGSLFAIKSNQRKVSTPLAKIAEYKLHPWRNLGVTVLDKALSVIGWLTVLTILYCYYIYMTIIRLALVNGTFDGWSRFAEQADDARSFVQSQPGTYLLFGLIAWWVLYVMLKTLPRFFSDRRYLRANPTFNRDLSEEELARIDAEMTRLAERLEARPVKGSEHAAVACLVLPVLLLVSGFLLTSSFETGLGASLFENWRAPTEQWRFYLDELNPLLLMLSFYGVAGLGLAGFFSLTPDWNGFYAPKAWTLDSQKRKIYRNCLQKYVTDLVRSGWFDEYNEFDPNPYIARSRARSFRNMRRSGAIYAGLLALCWIGVRMDYKLFTETGIERRSFEELYRKRVETYEDIRAIEVACRHAPFKGNFLLDYKLKMREGPAIEIVSGIHTIAISNISQQRLENWQRVDQLARAAGAPVIYMTKSFNGEERLLFDKEACISGLDAEVGKVRRQTIMLMLLKGPDNNN